MNARLGPKLPKTIRTDDGNVSLDPFAVAIRYHGCGEYGSPFTFVCTALIVGDEARLFAAAGKMTPAVWRAVATALRRIGIRRATFERRNRPRAGERAVDTAN